MRGASRRFDFVHEFVIRVFADDLHAKRILSVANENARGDDGSGFGAFVDRPGARQRSGIGVEVGDQAGRP